MEKIILNGKEISLQEFQEISQKLLNQKGMKLVEISPGNWRTRLLS